MGRMVGLDGAWLLVTEMGLVVWSGRMGWRGVAKAGEDDGMGLSDDDFRREVAAGVAGKAGRDGRGGGGGRRSRVGPVVGAEDEAVGEEVKVGSDGSGDEVMVGSSIPSIYSFS